MTRTPIADVVARTMGVPVRRLSALGGGCVGDVFRADLGDGRTVVVKAGGAGSRLDVEGFMLDYLERVGRLPVPDVVHAADTLLVMSFVETSGGLTPSAEAHAADLLARLHDVTAPRVGFERATLIGGLDQPNPWGERWIPFFRDHRLLHMARVALEADSLPAAAMARVEMLAGRLDRWLDEPERPSLLHGDMWAGNVLCRDGRVAAFVDPAVYYGDAEIELAFSTLFSTFGDAFFARYREHRAIRAGFFEARRHLYNLYPLLVHVRLFGGPYVAQVERTLARFGV